VSVTTRLVETDEADIRLDRWLRRHYPGLAQGAIQKFCRTGQVRVDGGRVDASARLAPGQSVRIPPLPPAALHAPAPPAERPPPDERARRELAAMVLYRDDQVIVLNKPHGLAVQGGPGIAKHLDGMLDALREGGERPRLVHRLDRDTSGVLLLARSAGTAAKLAAGFRSREMEKTYWAVVVGRPVPVEGRIEMMLARVAGARGQLTVRAEPGMADPLKSITDYRTLDHAARKLAWLELRPLTGRTHQLRVHCAELGAPILGDFKYGGDYAAGGEFSPQEGAARVAGLPHKLHLHARSLRLPHPAGGVLEVSAALPEHMRETFATIGFTAPATPAARRS
jgi:23S rRNA pseudouridine955/2504/2580 synthase